MAIKISVWQAKNSSDVINYNDVWTLERNTSLDRKQFTLKSDDENADCDWHEFLLLFITIEIANKSTKIWNCYGRDFKRRV